jgi:hypothetical protein
MTRRKSKSTRKKNKAPTSMFQIWDGHGLDKQLRMLRRLYFCKSMLQREEEKGGGGGGENEK